MIDYCETEFIPYKLINVKLAIIMRHKTMRNILTHIVHIHRNNRLAARQFQRL